MDAKLKEIFDLRIDNPECSLLELCTEYEKKYGNEMSKSGMKHRLKKIEEFAESI